MTGTVEQLIAMERTHDFFIGVDSDGCAFDTMAIKQRDCFVPHTIRHWGLEAIAPFVRETELWLNLRSRWRGSNRFPALVKVFDLLAERPECVDRGFRPLQVDSLRTWIAEEPQLGNPALEAAVARTNDPVLRKTLEWSKDINATIARTVRGVPPFPHVRESLARIAGRADTVVVSATPGEALQREWAEHDLARYARLICGQEMGKKAEHLKHGAGGKYEPDHVLMVGDAVGDLRAAESIGACFFPINPGAEADSWKLFHEEAAERFFAGEYRGELEDRLVEAFLTCLPSVPPWRT